MTPADLTPAVRLDVLGGTALLRRGEEVGAVIAQPKRLALLVYLALRPATGFLRRDELLRVFWPDSTQERARTSLRQALTHLRRHLGEEILTRRGAEEIGVRAAALRCDAATFVHALEAGDDEAALELYRGELLAGFVLPGAHDFDAWLHAERQALRSAALGAALRLAEQAESAADTGRAVARLRSALSLEPTNEAIALRLMRLLVRSGDRPGALATFEALERRLRSELELEPSAELVAEAATFRSAPESTGIPREGATARPVAAERVLVLDLEDLTGDERLRLVGRLAGDAVAQALTAIPELEIIPPFAALGAAADPAAAGAAPGPGRLELARRAGAGTLVEGTYCVERERLLLIARITDTATGRLLPAPDPVSGPKDLPLQPIEAFCDAVARTLAPLLSRRAVHLRHTRPPGLPAYTAYADGMECFARGEWQGALVHFQRAAELEPDYALPRVVCAIALWNLGELALARATALAATRLASPLGRFERAVLDMVLAWLQGDWAAAHRAARVQAALAPSSIPHFQVAEEARRLNRPREALAVLSRLVPETGELRGWIFYWLELATAQHMLGDHLRELAVARQCRELYPDDPAALLLELRALAALGRDAELELVADAAIATRTPRRALPGMLLTETALELRAHGYGVSARAVLDRALAWYREHRTAADPDFQRQHARALYFAGELTEARARFSELVQAPPALPRAGHHHPQLQAHLDEGYLAAIAAHSGDPRETEHWCRVLEQLDRPFLYGAQWFWLACVAALLDQPELAVRRLTRAFSEGMPFELFLHAQPHLARLRGVPRYDFFMRPRG